MKPWYPNFLFLPVISGNWKHLNLLHCFICSNFFSLIHLDPNLRNLHVFYENLLSIHIHLNHKDKKMKNMVHMTNCTCNLFVSNVLFVDLNVIEIPARLSLPKRGWHSWLQSFHCQSTFQLSQYSACHTSLLFPKNATHVHIPCLVFVWNNKQTTNKWNNSSYSRAPLLLSGQFILPSSLHSCHTKLALFFLFYTWESWGTEKLA